MRGNAEMHELVAPGSLGAVLDLLAAEPGQWTPIAGGTELMVAFSAGRLHAHKLVNLWGIPDLRFIEVTPESVAIGAAATFLDLRKHAVIAAELPLLAKAASWIGSVANQSRATLGGNLVNGSPAADSSPALLVYDAEIEMISVRGRRIPYSEFHTGYKRNVLAADELLYAIHLPRRFARHQQYLRKVGTRRAMAIAKVALGATALLDQGIIREIRLGAASLAPYPTRLNQTEAALLGQALTRETVQAARRALLAEVQAHRRYSLHGRVPAACGRESARRVFAGVAPGGLATVNATLAAWNAADETEARNAMLACCGAKRWAAAMVALRPIANVFALSEAADRVWGTMQEADWLEAFACHPRIGERKVSAHAGAQSAAWSREEQAQTSSANEAVLAEIADGNQLYEERFGFTYIVAQQARARKRCWRF